MDDELKKALRSALKDDKFSQRFIELLIKGRNFSLTEQERKELIERCLKTIEKTKWELYGITLTSYDKITSEQLLDEKKQVQGNNYTEKAVFIDSKPSVEEKRQEYMKFTFYNDTGRIVTVHSGTKISGTMCDMTPIKPLEERIFYLPENAYPWVKMWDYGEKQGLQILVSPLK